MDGLTFYFPILTVSPVGDLFDCEHPPFRFLRRKWETSTFDLATLATKHKLHLPYQVMDTFLAHCNAEIGVAAASREGAEDLFRCLRFGFYLAGQSPFLAPFVTSHSINAYSGINSRDSRLLAEKLPEGMRHGLTSTDAQVEAWAFELSLQCLLIDDQLQVTEWRFHQAATKAVQWQALQRRVPALRTVMEAAQTAPVLGSRDQSTLHIWCALEALFPKVSTEVSFRVALYLAQLVKAGADRTEYFRRVRRAYDLRSRVAHGARRDVTHEEWLDCWNLLLEACNAILARDTLPEEDALLAELLKGQAHESAV